MNERKVDERIARIRTLDKRFGNVRTNYLSDKSSFWKYLRYRILRPFLKLKYALYRRPKDTTPWFSPTGIEFFKEYLDGTQIGCEFGSGASTVFFSQRVRLLVSVEHYKPWFEKVDALLKERGAVNVDYRFIEKQEPDSNLTTQEMFPEIRGLENYAYRKDYIHYFQALKDFEAQFFDFIIVDGRARPECVFASISKLKSRGLLILDNSERARYSVVFAYLENWEMVNTTNGLTDTTFWVKP